MITIRCKAGDTVEVRSADEILATLDDNGCVDGLPFMPEMLQYCGRRLRVAASAHKTCDSMYYREGRRMEDTVFLEELRCDGSGHGGCEARCLLMFKLHWLRPLEPATQWQVGAPAAAAPRRGVEWLRSTAARQGEDGQPLYRCQATEHLNASRPFKANALSMFLADIRSRNAAAGTVLRAMLLQAVFKLRMLPAGWRLWVRLYDRLHRVFYGTRNPFAEGRIAIGQPTPEVRIGLKEGEFVRVRSIEEIEATMNTQNRNRGLSFNPEMSPYCGGVYKVERPVRRIVDERSGRMLEMKNPCIMLEGVHCQARYHPDAVLCRRKIPQYFREAWLERAGEGVAATPGGAAR